MNIILITILLIPVMLIYSGRLMAADGNLRERSIVERDHEIKEQRDAQGKKIIGKKVKSADTFIATAGRMVVEGSENRAVELLKRARSMRSGAEDDIKDEDYVQASKKLDVSINSALQAIAILVKGESMRDKALKELENEYSERRKKLYRDMIARKRTESEVFIETARRLLKEGDNKEAAGFLRNSISMRDASDRFAAAGELEKSVESLNESFTLAENAVRSIRNDKVVIHRIAFKDAEEEFNYEKENNETYLLMAMPVVKDGKENARQMVNEARELRKRSEGAAAFKNYSGALRDIRSSNGLLIKTIEGFNARTGKSR